MLGVYELFEFFKCGPPLVPFIKVMNRSSIQHRCIEALLTLGQNAFACTSSRRSDHYPYESVAWVSCCARKGPEIKLRPCSFLEFLYV